MRWKISQGGHDPRYVDLLAFLVLVIAIAAAFEFFGGNAAVPSTTSFIVPSQSVRW